MIAVISHSYEVVGPHRKSPRIVQTSRLVTLEAECTQELGICGIDYNAVAALVRHDNFAITAFKFVLNVSQIC